MGATDIDNVGVTPNVIGLMVKMDHISYLACGEQALEFVHGHFVVRSIVKSKVTDLN